MRADQVIATHGNTDFDAFGAMLAARLLYPDAVVALATLNRNVRDFYRLHADELGAVSETSRLELDAIRRLIVVEVTTASRLGELESVALDPMVETVLFDHHGEHGPPDWVSPESAVISTDGALTTTLVGILAERELQPTPLEATAFALGIHEDTGSLTYATTTQRDVDALAWCLRHGARQDLVAEYLHTPLAAGERELLTHLMERLEPVAADDVLIAAVRWPEYVDGVSNLAHKIVDLTDARVARAPRGDGRAGLRRRSESLRSGRRGIRRGRVRRWRPRRCGLGDLPTRSRRGSRASARRHLGRAHWHSASRATSCPRPRGHSGRTRAFARR